MCYAILKRFQQANYTLRTNILRTHHMPPCSQSKKQQREYNTFWYPRTKINYTMKATRPFPGGSVAVPRVLRYCRCQSGHATSRLHSSPARGLGHHHDCHRAPLISKVTSHEQETLMDITASPTTKAADDTCWSHLFIHPALPLCKQCGPCPTITRLSTTGHSKKTWKGFRHDQTFFSFNLVKVSQMLVTLVIR